MSKPSIIPNWKYQKPTKGGYKGLKKLLKYVSFRENPEHRPMEMSERWTDCGLGSHWREVYENAGKLAGPYVLAHHMVIAPAPDLMALLPDSIKHEIVREVTERTIEAWHAARGIDTPEYAYVLHDRDTSDDYGLQNLHTHVFIAGTVENGAGERESHRVDRQQVCTDRGGLSREDNLHRVARHEFETVLDRVFGPEWQLLREPERDQELPDPSIDQSPEIDL
jgi:hypothetical protein